MPPTSPMIPVAGDERHASRCLRIREIDWAAPPAGRKSQAAIAPGETVLSIDHLQKHYKVAANEIFGKGERRTVKANEDISLVAQASETVAIVGESGCGKSTLAKVLLGLETASGGKVTLAEHEIQSTSIENARHLHHLIDPDGVPESLRHAEPQPYGGLADHADAGKIRHRQERDRPPRPHA